MKFRRVFGGSLSAATVLLALFASPHEAAAQGDASEVERGRQLYMSNGCYACHGTVGQGGERSAAPRLAPEPYPYEAFSAFVRHPREAMPRFDERYVSDEQLRAIHRYLASIPKGRDAKDIPILQIGPR